MLDSKGLAGMLPKGLPERKKGILGHVSGSSILIGMD